MGVAALVRLVVAAGGRMSPAVWLDAVSTLSEGAADTLPAIQELAITLANRPPGPDATASLEDVPVPSPSPRSQVSATLRRCKFA